MTPDALARALRQPGAVLLDAPRPDADTGRRGATLFAGPRRVLRADRPDEVPALLAGLDAALAEGRHVAGALSYEAGYALEPDRFPEPPVPGDIPLGWFGVYDAPVEVPEEALAAVLARAPRPALRDLAFALDAEAYRERIRRVKAHIQEGDVYQINLTAPFRFRVEGGEPLGLFAALRERQPVAYGAYLTFDGIAIASVSPELFFESTRVPGAARSPRGP